MNIEELNLDDFDLSEIEIDEVFTSFKNIIYSQPFFSKDDFDYEFRITFDKENIILKMKLNIVKQQILKTV